MNVLIDILLVALFAFMAIRGYFKGFLKMVLSFGRLILSVVITLIFGAAFSGWIDKTFVNPPIYERVYGKPSELAGGAVTSVDSGNLGDGFDCVCHFSLSIHRRRSRFHHRKPR